MLQQTTVAAVDAYFRRFLERWPTVGDLAAAPLDDVLHAWQGLGYYARARNLHKCAIAVVERHGGVFPDTEAALLDLPGVGTYTAAAIAAIAFDRKATPVDGNIERVVARLFAIETPLPAAKPALRDAAALLTPARRAGDFAQAGMDLGATVCTPRSPLCMVCPLSGLCAARAAGIAAELPRRAPKAKRPVRRGVAFWLTRPDGAVLLRRRQEKGLLGGMMEVPSSPWREGGGEPDAAAMTTAGMKTAPLTPRRWRAVPGIVRHVFTHFELELSVACGEVAAGTAAPADCVWVAADRLHEHALPSVMKKIVRHVASGGADA